MATSSADGDLFEFGRYSILAGWRRRESATLSVAI
jgi:hypothetical protein